MNGTSTGNIQADIERLGPWFHNLHLPDGTETAPSHWLGDFPMRKWVEIEPHIPERLDGWRVLDIGCNAGFYTLQFAARGADVTAIDVDERYLSQARWAAELFGVADKVSFRQMSVYELARLGEAYDLVWFLGVLYHLRHPLLALDILRNCTERMFVLQTMTMPGDAIVRTPEDISLDERDEMLQDGWPVMAFIENRLAADPTNWWAPNQACVEAMLRSSGFVVESNPAHEVFICRVNSRENTWSATQRKEELRVLLGD